MTDPSTRQLVDLLRDAVEHRTALLAPPPSPERIRRVAVRRRTIGSAGLLGAAGVAAAGIALGGGPDRLGSPAVVEAGGPSSPGAGPLPSPPRSGPAGTPASAQEARARADRIVAGVVVPPGAIPSASSPIEVAVDQGDGGYVVTASRFWTVEGTMARVEAFFTTQPQNGTVPVADSESTGPRAGNRTRTFIYEGLRISVGEAQGGAVAIRADATAIWAPARTAGDRIAADVVAVEVTTVTTTAPERVLGRRTVTGADARDLVDLVNGLDRDTRPIHPCPPRPTIERLLVTTRGGTQTVRIASCGRVSLVLAADVSVDLVASTALTEAVAAVLGPLPATPSP